MGYYARHLLRVDGPATEEQIWAALQAHCEYGCLMVASDLLKLPDGDTLLFDGWNGDSRVKWARFHENALAISAALPGNVVTFVRIGEEWNVSECGGGDVAKYVLRDGKEIAKVYGESKDGIRATFPKDQ